MTTNKVVFANGCFDVLHAGHCAFLNACVLYKELREADLLIVAIDSDAKIKKDKGQHRPYYSQEERRKAILETFFEVDVVIIFDTNEELECHIRRYQPLLVKGERWKGNVVGEEYAEQVLYVRDYNLPSTTEIEARIRKKHLKELKAEYPGADL
jgi:cytidyltransferase-like protein